MIVYFYKVMVPGGLGYQTESTSKPKQKIAKIMAEGFTVRPTPGLDAGRYYPPTSIIEIIFKKIVTPKKERSE